MSQQKSDLKPLFPAPGLFAIFWIEEAYRAWYAIPVLFWAANADGETVPVCRNNGGLFACVRQETEDFIDISATEVPNAYWIAMHSVLTAEENAAWTARVAARMRKEFALIYEKHDALQAPSTEP